MTTSFLEFSASLKAQDSEATFSIDEVVYEDEAGNLLDVSHNMEKLSRLSGSEWKALFEKRAGEIQLPYSSGVWSKKEWVLPHIPDEQIISLGEGWSQLLFPPHFNRHFNLKNCFVKLCGNSHTGSFKDLGMTALVSHVNFLRKAGVPIKAVACASTGDTSAALSAYCAAADIPSIVFLPKDKISVAQLIQPISNGSLVMNLDTDFDGCMEVVKEVTKDKQIYLANSMNPMRIEGQKTISIEICQQMGWEVPDTVIIPGGNLGNVSALGSGFDMLLELGLISRKPQIVVAQAARANPLYQAYLENFASYKPVKAGQTLASAIRIGAPVSFYRAVRALKKYNGKVVQVTEEELANAAHLADRSGLYCCPHTGVALGGLIQLLEKKEIDSQGKIVVISTAHGLKFSEFKVGYHKNELEGIESKYANPIVECPADAGLVRNRIAQKFSA